MVITGVGARAQMANALRRFAGLPEIKGESAGPRATAAPHQIDAAAG
jgi:hypothetical protein